MTHDWKTWGVEQWNDHLLEYFFSNCDDDPPVVVMLVTSDEIARATGDSLATADLARLCFVDSVRRAVQAKGLLEDASNYRGWPTQPPVGRPKFIAHLVLTCLAASESSEELADEGSFIARLCRLVEVPPNSLSMLPTLWVQLAKWLSQHDRSYRRLVLPDPGGLTRIGYTVKLTFPDRRDQQRLSQLLDDAGIAGMVPPTGRALSVVGAERGRFGPAFQLAFDDFKRQFESHRSNSAELSIHRFWAAVVDAALRGRGVESSASWTRFSILAEESDDALSLFAVSDRAESSLGREAVPLLAPCGRWQFGLVPQGQTFESGGLQSIVTSTLAGRTKLPRISNFIDQGILPFALGSHGILELVDRDQLAAATTVLVHQDKVSDLLKHYPKGRVRSSSYEGWREISEPRLHALPSSVFQNSNLERSWILQESLSQPTIGLRGGVRTEEGWLGVSEVLPAVVVDSCSSVWLYTETGRVDLVRDAEGSWRFPIQDWDGQFEIVAKSDHFEIRRTIRFNSTTSSESFKSPREPCAWLVESMCASATLDSTLAEEHASRDGGAEISLDEPILLGAGIGEFVSDPASAAWSVRAIGKKITGRRGALREEAALPTFRVDSKNARRRWLNLVLKSEVDPSDPEFGVVRRRVKGIVASGVLLPSRSLSQIVPNIAPRRFESPRASVDRLVRVIAGRAASRAGLPWREWMELVPSILRIDAQQLGHLTRAWMEAGFIDVASSARWRNRAVFVRSPRLLAFRTGGMVNAVVSGLILPVTQDSIREAAHKEDLLQLDCGSVSGLVPPVLRVVGHDEEAVTTLAKEFGFPIAWLSVDTMKQVDCTHVTQGDAPTQYEFGGEWRFWSLLREPRSDIRVEHYFRADRPDYWVAHHEGASFWSYELNPIRAWSARRLREPLVSLSGVDDVTAFHGYLPLPVARFVNVLGQGLSGPTGGGEYRYPAGAQLRGRVVAALT
ncbi:hypothetical protein [Lysobacter capsici]|uniref:hypothetical protein n=1 Tax=Lysobacter capsici TaxID=435897 RepID=UPI001C00757D|nr:hypothetical protein [Lysobacter capsici]QWF19110.1 hypothetical protein KME82_10415 [Lysobacter capsici]